MKRNYLLLLVTLKCSVTKAQTNLKTALFLFLFTLANGIFAQTPGLNASASLTPNLASNPYYYWYKNQKKYLQLNTSKKFLLLKNNVTDSASLSQRIGNPHFKGGKISRSKVLYGLSKHDSLSSEKNYCVVENMSKDTSFVNNSDILYEAPAFSFSNAEVAVLSHLFYVKLKHDTDIAQLQTLAAQHTVEILGNNHFMPLWYTLSCSKQSSGNAMQMANLFYETGLFTAAEPDLMTKNHLSSCPPNDQHFSWQWNLYNTGQYDGFPYYGDSLHPDIKICNVWDYYSKGSNDVIVAVIDMGVQANHPDLNNIHPVSYYSDFDLSPDPWGPWNPHGTEVAGIIGANMNNNIGIAGVAPESPIMSVRSDLSGLVPNLPQSMANAISFAWKNGASVINNSWYLPAPYQDQIVVDAIDSALTYGRNGLGCVVVFSSGPNDNSASIGFPANSLSDIIVVGAISPCGERWTPTSCEMYPYGDTLGEGSRYGSELDIMAPGVWVPSTDVTWWPYTGYINTGSPLSSNHTHISGTSLAAPHVAGVAALMLAVNPFLPQHQVGTYINQTAQKINPNGYPPNNWYYGNTYNYSYNLTSHPDGSWNNEMGYGLLDAFGAVVAAKSSCSYYGGSDPDLYMKDQYYDFGEQPFIDYLHPTAPVYWNSPDIWVRQQPDGFTNQIHQNAEYGQANYVYVRVRNKGCGTSAGNDTLNLYWAKASSAIAWPNMWTGLMNTPSLQWGNILGTQIIDSLNTGEHTIFEFVWYPPNPADYGSYEPWHFCLLARIIETNKAPSYGIPYAQGSSSTGHANSNNNIALKNMSVYNIIRNEPLSNVIGVGNIHETRIDKVKFTFSIPSEQQSHPIIKYAQVKLHLDNGLKRCWVTGGRQGENIEMQNDSTIVMKGDGAWIGNIAFDANEYHKLGVEIIPTSEPTQDESHHFSFDIIQHDDTALTGGERFEVNFETNNEEQERIAQSTSISTPTIIPGNPTTEDSIKAKYNLRFPSQPAYQLSLTAVSVSGSVVTIEEHFAQGLLTLITDVPQTSTIGLLPAGYYKLVCKLHRYEFAGNNAYNEIALDKDSTFFIVTGSPVSVVENANLLQSLSMRPNPAANKLNISSDKNVNDLQIQIVSLTGENLLSTNCKSNCEIDISQLLQGVYFVNIYQKEKFIGVKKLVVMR